jgi:hypothetical protein
VLEFQHLNSRVGIMILGNFIVKFCRFLSLTMKRHANTLKKGGWFFFLSNRDIIKSIGDRASPSTQEKSLS